MMQTEPLSMTQSANHRIRSFRQRFGDGHFYLACHAALPLALTPDLLYRLWATFQRDCQDDDLGMPWVSVSDLLLSGLCDEVGDELYEMDSTVRDELMQQLKDSPRLGLVRVRELAEFVIAYIDPQWSSTDLDTRDFAQAQHWRALAYKQPREAVQAIATTLAELSFDETHEWIRMAALVETLEDPLVEFPELLVYVGAIDDFARGNDRSAIDKLKQIADVNQQIEIADIDLPIPVLIQPDPLPPEPVLLERKTDLIDRLKQNAYWLIGGGIAVTTVAIGAILYISSNTETSRIPPSIISAAPSPKITPSPVPASPKPTRSVSPSPTASESPTPSPTSIVQPVFPEPTISPDIFPTSARINSVTGQAEIIYSDRKIMSVKNGDVLLLEGTLKTGQNTRVELTFNDGTSAKIGESSTFRFTPNTRRFDLGDGTYLFLVPPGRGATEFYTPNAKSGKRG